MRKLCVGLLLTLSASTLGWAQDTQSFRLTESYPITYELSPKEACENAEEALKQSAMSLAGCEKLSYREFESCTGANSESRCSFFRDTFIGFDDCFVASYIKIDEDAKRLNDSGELNCAVEAQVSISKFKDRHDPSFMISVDDDVPRVFQSGQPISIKGKTSRKSFLYVLAWYPEIDKQHYHTIYPMGADGNGAVEGRFVLPPASYPLVWDAMLPSDFARDEANEFLIVLASKAPIAMLEKEEVGSFYKRLDDLGRANWRLTKFGYRIIR